MIPKRAVMRSGLVATQLRQARAEGRAKGRAEVVRLHQRTCVAIVKWFHPGLVRRVKPVIEACSNPLTLHEWTKAATHLFSDELERLVTGTDQVEEWLREQRALWPELAGGCAADRHERRPRGVSTSRRTARAGWTGIELSGYSLAGTKLFGKPADPIGLSQIFTATAVRHRVTR